MLDIHTHILPKMDDGSSGSQESVDMLKLSWEQGIREIALTPHFYPDRESPEEFLKGRMGSALRLKEVLRGEKRVPRLYLGAEVAYFPGFSRVKSVHELCIERTKAMLIEMPFCRWSSRMLEELQFLQDNAGIQPVLAHIERYLRYQPPGLIQELAEGGVMMQANASFFIERGTAWIAMRMLKRGYIHLLGSDCHNMRSRRPNLGQAVLKIEDKFGPDMLDYFDHMQERLWEEKQ